MLRIILAIIFFYIVCAPAVENIRLREDVRVLESVVDLIKTVDLTKKRLPETRPSIPRKGVRAHLGKSIRKQQ